MPRLSCIGSPAVDRRCYDPADRYRYSGRGGFRNNWGHRDRPGGPRFDRDSRPGGGWRDNQRNSGGSWRDNRRGGSGGGGGDRDRRSSWSGRDSYRQGSGGVSRGGTTTARDLEG